MKELKLYKNFFLKINETVVNRSKVIALNCDSDCYLQDGIDLLKVAVMNELSLVNEFVFRSSARFYAFASLNLFGFLI